MLEKFIRKDRNEILESVLEQKDVDEISKIQYKILENCSKYLKKNGEIVYSTCSIFKKENEGIIEKFVKNNLEFQIEKFDFEKNSQLKNEKKANLFFQNYIKNCKYLEVYQNEKTDGFFICKMTKKY